MIRAFVLAAAALLTALAPRALAAETPWPGARFSVEVRGSGPDVILIPGLASSRAVWNDTALRLERNHRVHLVQVAGFAGEPIGANASGLVVAPLVEDLARYVRDRKLKQTAVIGHSLGGAAGLALAARHPEAVERVLAVDSLSFFSLLFGPGATPENVRPQADAIRDGTLAMPASQFEAIQNGTARNLAKGDAARAEMVRWSLSSDRGVVARGVHELMTTDLRPELSKIRAQVTVLYAWDAAMPYSTAQTDALWSGAYTELAGAKLVRVDDSYHFIMWDQPDRFAAEVDAFLSGR